MVALLKAPYWRLALLYFCYFTAVGVIMPFWGLYLDYLGFSAVQIGVIVAIPMMTKIIVPNLWGWVADKTGQYLKVIRLGAFCAAALFTGVLWRTDYAGLVLFTVLFTFFWNAILPQFEVITLDALGAEPHRYAQVRLWGSLGFIFSVLCLGWVLEWLGVYWVPRILWLCLLLIAGVTLVISQPVAHKQGQAGGRFIEYFNDKTILSFFAASVLLHLSHGVFYGFYSLHLVAEGYSKGTVGLLWALGVVAEIVVFAKMPLVFRRVNLWWCYFAGCFVAGLRWWLVASATDILGVMVLAQMAHALTFAVTHAAAIEIVRQSFPSASRGRAQALYSALCFGAGGALGAYSGGLLWQQGGAHGFYFAGCSAFVGAIVVWFGMRRFNSTAGR